jgi:MFS family permease
VHATKPVSDTDHGRRYPRRGERVTRLRSRRGDARRGAARTLRERDFRLLFAYDDHDDRRPLAGIARSPCSTSLGQRSACLRGQTGVQALVVVGGRLSDRIRATSSSWARRSYGIAQALTAVSVLGHIGGIAAIVALQAVYGLGLGLVLPAEVGLVPQIVSPERLQQANALQELSRNMIGVLGPAVAERWSSSEPRGGARDRRGELSGVCRSPSTHPGDGPRREFVARLRPRASRGLAGVHVEDMALGVGRLFGIGNLAFAGWIVLGPRSRTSGSAGRPWAAILTAGGVGAVIGGVRDPDPAPPPVVVCVLAATLISLQTLALALSAPTPVIAAAAFIGGIGIAVHLTLWFTIFQQQVPEQAQSRVASYDTLGSSRPLADRDGARGARGCDRSRRDPVDRARRGCGHPKR